MIWPRDRFCPDPLAGLRGGTYAQTPLIAGAIGGSDLSWQPDPKGDFRAHWHSPQGRLLELDYACLGAVGWLGLHLPVPPDLGAGRWFGVALRHAADRPITLRLCLRAHLPCAGREDVFFLRMGMVGPEQVDHIDVIDPARIIDWPAQAQARELVLFLPVTQDYRWALHDLRLLAA